MTPAQFAAYVRLKTHTNSTTFTDADMLIFMGVRQDEIAASILKTDEDILLIPQTADLVASTISAREYPLPSDIISRVKTISAKLDGTNWRKLTELDINQLNFPVETETDITNHFSNDEGECFFDLRRKSIYIYSGTIVAGSAALKVYVDTYPTAISDMTSTTDMSVDPSTTTHGIPRPMHKIWATGVIIDYKSSKEKPIPLTEREQNYELDMQNAIVTLKHGNLDREVTGDLPGEVEMQGSDGSEF